MARAAAERALLEDYDPLNERSKAARQAIPKQRPSQMVTMNSFMAAWFALHATLT